MSSKIALILGAGARTGLPVAAKFKANGFKVAITSRSLKDSETPEGFYGIKADFTDPKSVPGVFEKVKAKYGVPNVVIYAAYGMTPPAKTDDLFSIPEDAFQKDVQIAIVSSFVAGREAVRGFDTLPADVPKSFILIGNIQDVINLQIPAITTLGVGKAGAAYWVGTAAASYAKKGYSFFYVDERTPEGGSVGGAISGDAHGEFLYALSQGPEKVPWHATFVKGKGYVQFPTSQV